MILALNLVPLSGIAFLWFIGVVRDRIGEREDRFFATVFLGRARDEMFAKTDTSWAPWYVIHSDDKRRTRLNIITHLLNSIDYKAPPRSKVKLPDRQKRRNYREPDYRTSTSPRSTEPRSGPSPWPGHSGGEATAK